MSGIAGIFNLDGQPVNPEDLERMAEALAHRGPDGLGVYGEGACGLACQNFWVTPESEGEIQPLKDSRKCALVFDGRLDNREELMESLRLPAARDASDAALILEAYHKLEENLPAALKGEFAFSLWDSARQRLLVARDAVGLKTLHYFHDGNRFLFATEIKALLAHPAVPVRPNKDLLSDYLIDRVNDHGLTFFEGIFTHLPGYIFLINSRSLSRRRFWDFEPRAEIRLGSAGEYAEAFREVFLKAVRSRLRASHPVYVSVSGGLDSSSIFCAALKRGGGAALKGLSYISQDGSPSDEKVFLLEIEKMYGPDTIERIPIGPPGFFDSALFQAYHSESPLLDEEWTCLHRSLSHARSKGARTILTGHWGDQILFPTAYLADLFRAFRFPEVIRHLREFPLWMMGDDPKEYWRSFFTDCVKYRLPDPLHPFARLFLRGTRKKPWYSRAFHRRAFLRRWSRRPIGQGFRTAHGRSLYEMVRTGSHLLYIEWMSKVSAAYGLEISFPYLDRDLLSFLMAIPGEIQTPGGVPKGLLREAMGGILPEAIRRRRWKADFTHIINAAVENDFSRMVEKMLKGRMSQGFDFLKEKNLLAHLASLKEGLKKPTAVSSWELSALLGLEVWLDVFFSGKMPQLGGERKWRRK